MILYITDNPTIHKETPLSLLMYQLFDWTIKLEEESDFEDDPEFILKKRYKKALLRKEAKIADKIIGIVAPSNYKLINDLFVLGLEHKTPVKIYHWESWKKRSPSKVKRREVYALQNRYIQRGYLTLLMYQSLSFLNLQRVEQLMVLIVISALNHKTLTVKKSSQPGAVMAQSLVDAGYSIRGAVDKLIYHSRKLDISDPFLEGPVSILNDNSSIVKKLSLGKSNQDNLLHIVGALEHLFPLTDILKTIRFLEKNEFIETIDGDIVENFPFSKEDVVDYLPYIDVDRWREIYLSQTFLFGSSFPPLQLEKIDYACPICGSTALRTTPTHFYCSDILCPLKISRIIKPGGIEKRVSENEFIRLIHFGSTIIKNRIGGYNRFFLSGVQNKLWISTQMEKSIEEN